MTINRRYQDECHSQSDDSASQYVPPMMTPIGDTSQATVESEADPGQL